MPDPLAAPKHGFTQARAGFRIRQGGKSALGTVNAFIVVYNDEWCNTRTAIFVGTGTQLGRTRWGYPPTYASALG